MNLFELYIASRYTKGSKNKKNKFISFISLISMMGITLGVATLIIVLSILNGFKYNTVNKILTEISHVSVVQKNFQNISDIEEIKNVALKDKNVLANSEKIITGGFVENYGIYEPVEIMGINPLEELKVSAFFEKNNEEMKNLTEKAFNVVVGKTVAEKLNLEIGKKLKVIVNETNMTPVGTIPRYKMFNIVGIVEQSNKINISGGIYINIKDLQVLEQREGFNLITFKLKDFWKAEDTKTKLNQEIKQDDLIIETWADLSKNLLSILRVEKLMTFIILMLIVIVAAFNLISSLVMTVTEKSGEIAILKTIGCRPSSILIIFMIQGSIIGLVGTILGTVIRMLGAFYIGEIVSSIQYIFNIQMLNEFLETTEITSVMLASDIVPVIVGSLVLSVLATIYPSWTASNINPAEALKYE